MRLITDHEWLLLSQCSVLAQSLYLFGLREEADRNQTSTVSVAQADLLAYLEHIDCHQSRDAVRRALAELESQDLVTVVRRRPRVIYRLNWVWPPALASAPPVFQSQGVE